MPGFMFMVDYQRSSEQKCGRNENFGVQLEVLRRHT
jgi:hypothetical protein